ncbi:hypothetical protein SEUCBS140593_003376 [Sporothrix eucalyptigena]|uniref:Uncharacterized protein n=1 Tax=Sporothrix eucalyptigena TaxID=1812306 RepID=A0ABP0BFH7_9PEZI
MRTIPFTKILALGRLLVDSAAASAYRHSQSPWPSPASSSSSAPPRFHLPPRLSLAKLLRRDDSTENEAAFITQDIATETHQLYEILLQLHIGTFSSGANTAASRADATVPINTSQTATLATYTYVFTPAGDMSNLTFFLTTSDMNISPDIILTDILVWND